MKIRESEDNLYFKMFSATKHLKIGIVLTLSDFNYKS